MKKVKTQWLVNFEPGIMSWVLKAEDENLMWACSKMSVTLAGAVWSTITRPLLLMLITSKTTTSTLDSPMNLAPLAPPVQPQCWCPTATKGRCSCSARPIPACKRCRNAAENGWMDVKMIAVISCWHLTLSISREWSSDSVFSWRVTSAISQVPVLWVMRQEKATRLDSVSADTGSLAPSEEQSEMKKNVAPISHSAATLTQEHIDQRNWGWRHHHHHHKHHHHHCITARGPWHPSAKLNSRVYYIVQEKYSVVQTSKKYHRTMSKPWHQNDRESRSTPTSGVIATMDETRRLSKKRDGL